MTRTKKRKPPTSPQLLEAFDILLKPSPPKRKKRVFRSGQCRNNDKALTHTYEEFSDGSLLPMCGYGWNRSDGHAFSIFRGALGTEGDCLICQRNVAANKPATKIGIKRKTRWI